MSDKKIIAVIGATGAQGGGLVRAILADPGQPFAVRAITRKTTSDKAQALAKAAGAKLGHALTISTEGVQTPMPPMPMMMKAERMSMAASDMSVAPSLPGMVKLHESVHVVFALE